jgi:hypothetical protein
MESSSLCVFLSRGVSKNDPGVMESIIMYFMEELYRMRNSSCAVCSVMLFTVERQLCDVCLERISFLMMKMIMVVMMKMSFDTPQIENLGCETFKGQDNPPRRRRD